MYVLTTKTDELRMGPKAQNGDFLENGSSVCD
jgi:hypothetical protein